MRAPPRPRPVGRRTLDRLPCMVPGCTDPHCGTARYLHGACHPRASVFLQVVDGVLDVTCSVCDKLVVRICVAPPPWVLPIGATAGVYYEGGAIYVPKYGKLTVVDTEAH